MTPPQQGNVPEGDSSSITDLESEGGRTEDSDSSSEQDEPELPEWVQDLQERTRNNRGKIDSLRSRVLDLEDEKDQKISKIQKKIDKIDKSDEIEKVLASNRRLSKYATAAYVMLPAAVFVLSGSFFAVFGAEGPLERFIKYFVGVSGAALLLGIYRLTELSD